MFPGSPLWAAGDNDKMIADPGNRELPEGKEVEIMFDFLAANIGTIVVGVVLAAIVFLAVRSIVKEKKKGQCSCGCNCSSCAMSGTCHKK